MIELRLQFSLWLLFAGSIAVHAWNGWGSSRREFAGSSVAIFLLSFTVMIYFTYSRTKTHIKTRPDALIDSMRDRLPPKSYAEWLAEPRAGIAKLMDLKGSSLIPPSQLGEKQTLLAWIEEHFRATQLPRDFLWMDYKAVGDSRVEVFRKKHEDVIEDFREVIEIAARQYGSIMARLRHVLPDVGLHFAVCALDEYIFRERPTSERDDNVRGKVDYASRTADLAFKFASKSKRPGRLIVSGRRCHFPGSVRSLLEGGEVFALADMIRAEHPGLDRRYAEQAEELDIVFGYVQPLDEPGFEMPPPQVAA